ncbi:MAG: hypothetical protein NWR54_05310 [Paracoccaceae bacterium]|nr:hypothetical protein [Paracoccaceae bacterium]
MKLPPVVLGVIAVLTAAAGTLGYLAGARQAELTETDVIMAYANRYVADHGLAPEAIRMCHAVPGADARVWLVVICAAGREAERAYFVGRGGGLLPVGRSGDRPFAAPIAPEA